MSPKVGIYRFNRHYTPAMQTRYMDVLLKNGIDCVVLSISDNDFWDRVGSLDLLLFLMGQYGDQLQQAKSLLPALSMYSGLRCFPDINTAWHFDDKIGQYALMKARGFPFIETSVFYDEIDALEWVGSAQFPVVFKLTKGAGSSNVRLVSNQRQAVKLIRLMFGKGVKNSKMPGYAMDALKRFGYARGLKKLVSRSLMTAVCGYDKTQFWGVDKNYIMFQKFLSKNTYDTRITVIGNRAFGFIRHNRKGDFRASGSGLIDWDPKKVDLNCVITAFEVSKGCGFQSMAYDFLYEADGSPKICEISYSYNDFAIYKCPGHWNPDLEWIPGPLWPEYCILKDLLGSCIADHDTP